VAPIFENANVATDHNALVMDMLRKVAQRHKLVCLLHEKPFAGVNGSGKHCNWSMSTNSGDNLLEPGKTPHQNLRFLAVLSIVLKAVYHHSGLLRAGIASPGNDHRLGANEAPPAIVSVFLGENLSKICQKIQKGEVIEDSPEEALLNLGVSHLPRVSKDNTDRNRTSPFAFTGNKFEFRAVGSSSNVALPMTFLNAAVAKSFQEASLRLKKMMDGKSPNEAVLALIRENLKESQAIQYEGNNYSKAWVKEAESRGLPHLKNTAEALAVLKDHKQTGFLEDLNILTPEEVAARYHVALERYCKQVEMEAATLLEMTETFVIPATEKELIHRCDLSARVLSQGSKKTTAESTARLQSFEALYQGLALSHQKLDRELKLALSKEDESKKAQLLAENLMPAMEELRAVVDELEGQIDDQLWPLPKYREILFLN
jgi:glutamine synthetase